MRSFLKLADDISPGLSDFQLSRHQDDSLVGAFDFNSPDIAFGKRG